MNSRKATVKGEQNLIIFKKCVFQNPHFAVTPLIAKIPASETHELGELYTWKNGW